MVKWMRNEVLKPRKMFSLENFSLRKKIFLKMMLDRPLLKKMVYAFSPKLLFHSPKENGTNGGHGVEILG